MVNITASMGRTLNVTADHPVILHKKHGFDVVPAFEVAPGDELMALCELPSLEQAPTELNLIELLRETPLEVDVYVSPLDTSFTDLYPQYAKYVPTDILRYPHEIKRNNRMSLRLF